MARTVCEFSHSKRADEWGVIDTNVHYHRKYIWETVRVTNDNVLRLIEDGPEILVSHRPSLSLIHVLYDASFL